MDNIKYSDFTNIGKSWYADLDAELIKLYNDDKKDIIELAVRFKRSPGAIGSRLMQLNVIPHRTSARGYENYKNSKLYQEACENSHLYKKNKTNSKYDIVKSFDKLTNHVKLLTEKIEDYKTTIKEEQNKKLNENIKTLTEKIQNYTEDSEYETILIKNKEYFLIENNIYKIKKVKGDFYGIYDPTNNKVIKNKNKLISIK